MRALAQGSCWDAWLKGKTPQVILDQVGPAGRPVGFDASTQYSKLIDFLTHMGPEAPDLHDMVSDVDQQKNAALVDLRPSIVQIQADK